jgi:hypothetical protein
MAGLRQLEVVRVSDNSEDGQAHSVPEPRRLSPEAQRALKEAEERRRQRDAEAKPRPKEEGGPKGPEPTRYGDWEKGGIVSDF